MPIPTLSREEMEAVLKNGGSVLFHPRDAEGNVTALSVPYTKIEQLPDEIQLGKYRRDTAQVDAGKAELQAKIDALQAELDKANADKAEAEDSVTVDSNSDYASLTNFPQKKKWAKEHSIEFNNQTVKGPELDALVTTWQATQKSAE